MVKSKKAEKRDTEQSTENFDTTINRIEGLVKKLEGGELSLEKSLDAFEEGMKLVKRAETILEEAEKRVEILVSGRDGEDDEVPSTKTFDIPEKA